MARSGIAFSSESGHAPAVVDILVSNLISAMLFQPLMDSRCGPVFRLVRVGVAAATLILCSANGLLAAEKDVRTDGFSASAAAAETHCSLSSAAAVSSSDNARFASRHLLLLNQDPHPLMQRVGRVLQSRLEECPFIERLEYVGAPGPGQQSLNAVLTEGARGPDLFLRFELRGLKESGWVNRELDATISATLGEAPWQSHTSTVDETTPPVIRLHWNGQLQIKSNLRGFETPKYRGAAEEIASEFTKAITNQLAKLHSEYGSLPQLPAALYGEYKPAPDLRTLGLSKAERLVSYRGLLTHNETFWRLQIGTNPLPQLQAFAKALSAEQWQVNSSQLTNPWALLLHASNGDARLELFEPRNATLNPGADMAGPSQRELIVHYRQPFSRAERQAALQALLDEPAPMETLLLFEHSYSGVQSDILYALLDGLTSDQPGFYLSLARMHRQHKEMARATHALIRAQALLATLRDVSKLEAQIEAAAKEISPGTKTMLVPTEPVYRELGFRQITNGAEAAVVEKPLEDPLLLYSIAPNGQPRTLCLRLNPTGGKNKTSFDWVVIQTQQHGRTWSSGSFDTTTHPSWKHTASVVGYSVSLVATPLQNGRRVRFEVQVTDKPSP